MPLRGTSDRLDQRHLRVEVGEVVAYDSQWEDLRFPAQAINPAGQASPPGVETTGVASGLLLFDAAGVEIVAGLAQMPHGWDEGTAISPHVHWQKTTSATGNVLWKLDYEVVANGAVAAMDYGDSLSSATVAEGTPDSNTANQCLITGLGTIDMTGQKASALIFWRLSRVGSDGSDTYGADARLLELDFHYRVNSFGSQDLFTKYEVSGGGI